MPLTLVKECPQAGDLALTERHCPNNPAGFTCTDHTRGLSSVPALPGIPCQLSVLDLPTVSIYYPSFAQILYDKRAE